MDKIKRIEGIVFNREGERERYTLYTDGGTIDRSATAATLFISKDATPPKVVTEQAVREMLREAENRVAAMSGGKLVLFFKDIAAKHGITL